MDTQNGFSDILSSLMQNPEIMKMVSSLASEKTEDTPKETPDTKAVEPADTNFTIPPELLASLPQMMSALQGIGFSKEEAPKESENKKPKKNDQRRELLCALKPFLSEKRCNVIDSLLQFEGLAGVLGSFSKKQ